MYANLLTNKKERLNAIFKVSKPVIGLIQLHGECWQEMTYNAYHETILMVKNGIDAVLIKNVYTNAMDLESVLKYFKEYMPDIIYGVNYSQSDHFKSFFLAKQYNASFIKLDYARKFLKTDNNEAYDKAMIFLKKNNPNIFVLGSIESHIYDANENITLEAKLQKALSRFDAIVIEEKNDIEVKLKTLKSIRQIVGQDNIVFIGSGLNLYNVKKQFKQSDGGILTGFVKEDSEFVSLKNIQSFMHEAKDSRRQNNY